MYTGSLGTVSNRETWTQAIDVVDDAGDDVNIAAASISLAVRKKGDSSPSLTASVGSGITVATPRFTFTFTSDQMRNLCAGNYDVGCLVTIAGTATQLIIGEVTIKDGVVD
jgi:hypothetical protein